MEEKISIIVPVYNVEKYLEKCLDSIIGQTYRKIRIICVNDGSTDGSLAILEKYKKKDSRIEIVNKKNGGLSSARNAGLEHAKTDYVMFCDSDDYYSTNICNELVKAIERDDSDLAICGINVEYLAHEEMRESDRKYYRLEYHDKNYIDDELILLTDVSATNKIFRLKKIKDNNLCFPEGINNEDFYFYNAYMSVSGSISFVNKKLYNYVRREDSIMSGNFNKNMLSMDHLLVAEKLFTFYKETGFLKEHTDLFWRQWTDSFWFSTNHSSKKYYKKIRIHAKKFATEKIEKYPPKKDSLKREVKYIITNNLFLKIRRGARNKLASAYKTIDIGFRQQSFINNHIEDLQKKIDELTDRIDNLSENEDQNGKV